MSELPLRVDSADDTDATIVTLVGELDASTAVLLDGAMTDAGVRPARKVIADVSEVTFVDSAGLRSLLTARAELARGGRELVLRGVSSSLRRLLQITALTGELPEEG